MADGSIEFSTDLDNADLEKNLKQAEKDISRFKEKLENDEISQTALEKAMERGKESIAATEAEIESLKARLEELKSTEITDAAGLEDYKAKYSAINDALISAQGRLSAQRESQAKLTDEYSATSVRVSEYTGRLEAAQARQAQLASEYQAQAAKSGSLWARAAGTIKAKLSGAAMSAKAALSNAAQQSVAPWENFGRRVSTMLRKAFAFGVILTGIRSIKAGISGMLAGNQQLQSSVANLKSVMNGFLGAMASTVAPVLTQVVNTLAGLFERIAGFIDSFFGTNIVGSIQQQREQMSATVAKANAEKRAEYEGQVAKAEERQAKAAKKLAKNQKEANRQLMGFDEINAMSAESSEEAADAMEDYYDGIEAPEYETDPFAGLGMGDTGMFQGILDWLDMIRDRIENDVMGPFARIREGLGLISQGIGEIIQGIMTGDWALVWKGFGDVVIGALYVIEGAFGAFMDWLNEVTGGQFSDIFDGLKLTVHGFVEFVEGLLRGDLQLAITGLRDFVDGLAQTLHGIIDAAINGVLFLVNGVFGLARDGVSGFFDFLSKTFPELKGLFDGLKRFIIGALDIVEGTLKGVVDFAGEVMGGVVDGVQQLFSGLVDVIVGLFTGNASLIANGAKTMLNGVINVFESVVNGILKMGVDFLNGIINAANQLPGVSIGTVSAPRVSLPRLATGAVIPPNREFLAVLGDQRFGQNIEAPEGLIRKIVREESGGMNQAMMQQAIVAALVQVLPQLMGRDEAVTMNVDGREVMRALVPHLESMVRTGEWTPNFI